MREQKKADNVTLIGMPAAGKSTVGVLLAKRLGYSFVDVDIVIQEQEKRLEALSDAQLEEEYKATMEALLDDVDWNDLLEFAH